MKLYKKINLVIALSVMICIKGYSQDPTVPKTLYKISPTTGKAVKGKKDVAELPVEKKSVYSCETNSKNKMAVITVKPPGTETKSKETFVIKEEKNK